MGDSQKQGIVGRFIEDNYDELIDIVCNKYNPDSDCLPLEDRAAFRRTAMDPEDLGHDAMIKLLNTVDIVKLVKVPEHERNQYLFGCFLNIAYQLYCNAMGTAKNRTKLALINNLSACESAPPRELQDFENEDALSALTGVERAIIRNPELTITELHQRIGSSLPWSTFFIRYKSKFNKIKKVLSPD